MFHELGVFIFDWIPFLPKKLCWFWVDRSPNAGVHLLPCLYTMKEGCRGLLFLKLCVHIKNNNSLLHGKFGQFLTTFSSKFPDQNFASYVFYIYPCDIHNGLGLPVF